MDGYCPEDVEQSLSQEVGARWRRLRIIIACLILVWIGWTLCHWPDDRPLPIGLVVTDE